jgi:group I intron endonuclease
MINTGVVYLIENLINSKKYVGITTKTHACRWNGHVADAERGSTLALHKAIRKHGKENFRISMLQECQTMPELFEAERFWIESLNTHIKFEHGYNMTSGGEGSPDHITSESQRQKMREAHLGKIFTDEHCKNISKTKIGAQNPMYGKHLSTEHKAKICKSNIGKSVSEETTMKISNSLVGKKQDWRRSNARYVAQINDAQIITVHESLWAAARSIGPKACASNILCCCKGLRKQAYGFTWQLVMPS